MALSINANLDYLLDEQITAIASIFVRIKNPGVRFTCQLEGVGLLRKIPFNLLKIHWFEFTSDGGWNGQLIYVVSPEAFLKGYPLGYLKDMSPRKKSIGQLKKYEPLFITKAVLMITSKVLVNTLDNIRIYQLKVQISIRRAIEDLGNELSKYRFESIDIDVSATNLFGPVWKEVKPKTANVAKVNVHDTGNRMPGSDSDRNLILIHDGCLEASFSDDNIHELPFDLTGIRFTLAGANQKQSRYGISQFHQKIHRL